MTRFANLLMKEKTVPLPYEDPVTFGVNAATPLIEALTPAERDRIEMVITCTESAFDFGKSMSTYFHKLLGLKRNCRLFEVKNACYSGVAGLQIAVQFVLSQTSPGAKVLVIATDIARFVCWRYCPGARTPSTATRSKLWGNTGVKNPRERLAAITAARAQSVELHVATFDAKSVQMRSLSVQRHGDLTEVDVPHLLAAPADEVMVLLRIDFELYGGAAALQRADQTSTHQFLHVAIHSRG
jgi:hypothetical protein